MILASSGGLRDTYGGLARVLGGDDRVGAGGRPPLASPDTVSPRNTPRSTVPCTIRLVDGVGIAVPKGMEHLLADVIRAAQR